MDIDLDINNYNLDDLLKLFNLNTKFKYEDLKVAYKQVLMTHPDKSGLDKEYFLFFSKAFKLIKNVYDYSHKEESCARKQVYDANENVDKTIKKNLQNVNDSAKFNEKFNELFNKVRLEDGEQDTGYDEWFKSSIDSDNRFNASNVRDMNDNINQIKKEQRALIVHQGIQDLAGGNGGYNLIREKPTEYSSDIFSKLQYEDLKKAHTETVVPVTEDDYHSRRNFNNVNDLNVYRKQTETVSDSITSNKIYMNNKMKEEEENVKNAYKMMKQLEKIEESNKIWKANFKLLTSD